MANKDELGVAAWLSQLYAPEPVPNDELNAPMIRWLRRFYGAEGPASRLVVRDALLAYQLALAGEATAAALHDLEHATALRPRVAVEDHDGACVRISIDSGYTAPSMWELDKPEAFAEVATYFQEQLDQSGAGAWPTRDTHNVGLHAEVRRGAAVWRCRVGQHTVAAIGELDTAIE